MTATQKAIALLSKQGPMTPGKFAEQMWPRVMAVNERRIVEADAGKFLTRLVKDGHIKKEGRRYGARCHL